MALNLTSFDAALKQHYSGVRVENMAMRDNPALAMIKKDASAGGRNIPQPVRYMNPQGGSATIGDAITNAAAGGYEDFVLTRKKNYVIANIDNETIEATKDAKDTFLKATVEIDGAVEEAGNRLARQIFRGAGGEVGKISSSTTIGSTVLILDDPGDVFAFWKDQVLELSANQDGSSIRSGTLTVAGVDRGAGTVTMTAAITTGVAAAATGDYVFVEGDAGLCLSGFAAWLPDDAPAATAFFGVDRTVDSFLSGLRLDASGMTVEEAAQRMGSDLLRHGGKPDYLFLNPSKVADLAISLGSKREYHAVDVKGKASIGFRGFQIECGGKPITVVGDLNCPEERGYMLTLKDWTLYSAGKAPHILDRDGVLLRNSTTDDYQVRVASYA
jgi:hypothetical protein